jgi:hypothetical protein
MANQFNLTIIVNDIRCCSSDCINDQNWIKKRIFFRDMLYQIVIILHIMRKIP